MRCTFLDPATNSLSCLSSLFSFFQKRKKATLPWKGVAIAYHRDCQEPLLGNGVGENLEQGNTLNPQKDRFDWSVVF